MVLNYILIDSSDYNNTFELKCLINQIKTILTKKLDTL